MSKRAEQAALKAYPKKDALNKKATGHYDTNYQRRKAYQQSYEQAEKDLGWHSVKESLPPIDEEVIVLTDDIHEKTVEGANHISFGHRVREEGTMVINVLTGNSFFLQPKSYNGWNIPGVTHWMYLPKLEEK